MGDIKIKHMYVWNDDEAFDNPGWFNMEEDVVAHLSDNRVINVDELPAETQREWKNRIKYLKLRTEKGDYRVSKYAPDTEEEAEHDFIRLSQNPLPRRGHGPISGSYNRESIVEIPSGSGNKYRYVYEDGATLYRGPVGSAPTMAEPEFHAFMAEAREALASVRKRDHRVTIRQDPETKIWKRVKIREGQNIYLEPTDPFDTISDVHEILRKMDIDITGADGAVTPVNRSTIQARSMRLKAMIERVNNPKKPLYKKSVKKGAVVLLNAWREEKGWQPVEETRLEWGEGRESS